jgi:hypothetical protein
MQRAGRSAFANVLHEPQRAAEANSGRLLLDIGLPEGHLLSVIRLRRQVGERVRHAIQ